MNIYLQFVDHSPKVNEPENVKWKYIFNFKINCAKFPKKKSQKVLGLITKFLNTRSNPFDEKSLMINSESQNE